ncbi:uncharacterized protein LOC143275531 [Babylonia areolata]|uniref:uncharacterized protein LOC143275531 n=1 Tax=Babylonia areolata TaxID=304850 RepID=UPI003FCFC500
MSQRDLSSMSAHTYRYSTPHPPTIPPPFPPNCLPPHPQHGFHPPPQYPQHAQQTSCYPGQPRCGQQTQFPQHPQAGSQPFLLFPQGPTQNQYHPRQPQNGSPVQVQQVPRSSQSQGNNGQGTGIRISAGQVGIRPGIPTSAACSTVSLAACGPGRGGGGGGPCPSSFQPSRNHVQPFQQNQGCSSSSHLLSQPGYGPVPYQNQYVSVSNQNQSGLFSTPFQNQYVPVSNQNGLAPSYQNQNQHVSVSKPSGVTSAPYQNQYIPFPNQNAFASADAAHFSPQGAAVPVQNQYRPNQNSPAASTATQAFEQNPNFTPPSQQQSLLSHQKPHQGPVPTPSFQTGIPTQLCPFPNQSQQYSFVQNQPHQSRLSSPASVQLAFAQQGMPQGIPSPLRCSPFSNNGSLHASSEAPREVSLPAGHSPDPRPQEFMNQTHHGFTNQGMACRNQTLGSHQIRPSGPQRVIQTATTCNENQGQHPDFHKMSRSGEVNGSRTKEGERKRKGREEGRGGRGGGGERVEQEENVADSSEAKWNQIREKLVEEMRQSTLDRFPKLRHQTYVVPPIRTNKTKYQLLRELSTNRHNVMQQRELQFATLLGDQTEDTISRCLSEVVENVDEPMFILSNYQYDDYLFLLERGKASSVVLARSASALNGKNSSSRISQDGNDACSVTRWKRKPNTLSESSNDSDTLQSPREVEAQMDLSKPHAGETFPRCQKADEEAEEETTQKLNSSSSAVLLSDCSSSSDDGWDYQGHFPTPRDLKSAHKRGDFDNLVISPRLGFIVFEAKTMLGLETGAGMSTSLAGQCTLNNQQQESPKDPDISSSSSSPLGDCQGMSFLSETKGNLAEFVKNKSHHQTDACDPENPSTTDVGEGFKEPGTEEDDCSHTLIENINEGEETNQSESLSLSSHAHFSSPRSETDSPEHEPQNEDDPKGNSAREDFFRFSNWQEKGMSPPFSDSVTQRKRNSDSYSQPECDFHLQSPTNSDPECCLGSGPGARDVNEEDFRKTITKSLNQLRKAETVLRHLTRDLPGCPAITKVLALPNTSTEQLRQLLDDPILSQECCEVLETDGVDEALTRCLTSEHVTDKSTESSSSPDVSPGDATTDVETPLMRWWSALEKGVLSRRQSLKDGKSSAEKKMNDGDDDVGDGDNDGDEDGGSTMELSWDSYEQIISRFCGPFSRLKFRTVAECIHLTGVDFGRSILRQEQLKLLDSPSPFLCLTGPPGSGKTLLLALKAAEWAKQGDQVVVICADGVDWGSLVSWTLHDRIREHLKEHRLQEARRLAFLANPSAESSSTSSSVVAAGKTSERKKSRYFRQKKNKPNRSGSMAAGGCGEEGLHPLDGDSNAEQVTNSQQQGSHDVSARAAATKLVEKVVITRQTNVDDFVTELMEKYKGSNLRIIVDERPKYVTVEATYNHLLAAQNSLEEMRTIYTQLKDKVSSRSGTSQQKLLSQFPSDADVENTPSNSPEVQEDVDQEPKEREDFTSMKSSKENKIDINVVDSFKNLSVSAQTRETNFLTNHHDFKPNNQSTSSNAATNQPMTCQTPTTESLQKGTSTSRNETATHSWMPGESHSSTTPSTKPSEFPGTETSKRGTVSGDPTSQNPVSLTLESKTMAEEDAEEDASSSQHHHHHSKGDHFATMEDRMTKLDTRFSLMKPGGSGGPDIVHSDRWRDRLEVLCGIFKDVRQLKTEVAPLLLESPPSVYLEYVAFLEELSRLMVQTMGDMYHAYVNLTFFQVQQLFATLRARRVASAPPDARDSREMSVWSASVYSHYIPEGYVRGDLRHSIRCPPTVQRILKWTEPDIQHPPGYAYVTRGCDVSPPLPSDGPPVTWLDHSRHGGGQGEINDCAECGAALADHLLGTLGLRALERATGKRGPKGQGQGHQSQLYFHDVIICGSPIHQPECAFIQAMGQRGLRFEFESQTWDRPPPYLNKVIVFGGATVQGMEAKIVVFVPELKRITEEEKSDNVTAPVTSSPLPPPSPDDVTPDHHHHHHHMQTTDADDKKQMNRNDWTATSTTSSSSSNSRDGGKKGGKPFNNNNSSNNSSSNSNKNNSSSNNNSSSSNNSSCNNSSSHNNNSSSSSSNSNNSSSSNNNSSNNSSNKYSRSDLAEMERLRKLGAWNREYLWHVGSRSLSQLVVFHI